MTDAQILEDVKVNLGISASAYNTALNDKIAAAKAFVVREGVLNYDPLNKAEDAEITVMYAVWLWNRRTDPKAPMPRALRWALNNRVFSRGGAAT